MQILLKQRSAWNDFAKKNGLKVEGTGFMKSVIVSGTYKGIPMALYSESQPTPDQRSRKFRTILQFEIGVPMPVEGGVASGGSRALLTNLQDLAQTVKLDVAGWDESILIKSRSAETLRPYFTAERCQTIQALMSLKDINSLYIFDTTTGFVRLETADPMEDRARLERLCSKVTDLIKVLMKA